MFAVTIRAYGSVPHPFFGSDPVDRFGIFLGDFAMTLTACIRNIYKGNLRSFLHPVFYIMNSMTGDTGSPSSPFIHHLSVNRGGILLSGTVSGNIKLIHNFLIVMTTSACLGDV
jgi:hypothetical protein